jgi:enoyl-CoA hydratase/carnithine racemase
MASRMPGIFNLGGDLRSFANLIRQKDRTMLMKYGTACTEAQYERSIKMNLPVISISLVQGDALGGGFECALADDLIIAERSAKLGLPECLATIGGVRGLLARRCRVPIDAGIPPAADHHLQLFRKYVGQQVVFS